MFSNAQGEGGGGVDVQVSNIRLHKSYVKHFSDLCLNAMFAFKVKVSVDL